MRAISDLAMRLIVAVVLALLVLWVVNSGFIHKLIPSLGVAEFTQDKVLKNDLVQFCSDWTSGLGLRVFYPALNQAAVKEAGWASFCDSKALGKNDNQCRCLKACVQLLSANERCSNDPFSSEYYKADTEQFFYKGKWLPETQSSRIPKELASAFCTLNEAENIAVSIPNAPCINLCEATYDGQCIQRSTCSSGWDKRDLPNLCPTGSICCVKKVS